MNKAVIIASMILTAFQAQQAFAEPVDPSKLTQPTEVGQSQIPPGQYTLIDQVTHKEYELNVTTKGTMILGPSAPAATAATPATTPAATPAATPATTPAATAAVLSGGSAVQQLMKQGMQRGMTQLMKSGTKVPNLNSILK